MASGQVASGQVANGQVASGQVANGQVAKWPMASGQWPVASGHWPLAKPDVDFRLGKGEAPPTVVGEAPPSERPHLVGEAPPSRRGYTSRNPKGEAPPSGQTLGASPCAFGGTVLYQLALSQLCVVSALQYSTIQYSTLDGMFCCHMFPSHAPATVLYAYCIPQTVQYNTLQHKTTFFYSREQHSSTIRGALQGLRLAAPIGHSPNTEQLARSLPAAPIGLKPPRRPNWHAASHALSPAAHQSNFVGGLPIATNCAPLGTTSSFVMHTVLMAMVVFVLPLFFSTCGACGM